MQQILVVWSIKSCDDSLAPGLEAAGGPEGSPREDDATNAYVLTNLVNLKQLAYIRQLPEMIEQFIVCMHIHDISCYFAPDCRLPENVERHIYIYIYSYTHIHIYIYIYI